MSIDSFTALLACVNARVLLCASLLSSCFEEIITLFAFWGDADVRVSRMSFGVCLSVVRVIDGRTHGRSFFCRHKQQQLLFLTMKNSPADSVPDNRKRCHETAATASTRPNKQQIPMQTIFRLDYSRGVYVQVEIPAPTVSASSHERQNDVTS